MFYCCVKQLCLALLLVRSHTHAHTGDSNSSPAQTQVSHSSTPTAVDKHCWWWDVGWVNTLFIFQSLTLFNLSKVMLAHYSIFRYLSFINNNVSANECYDDAVNENHNIIHSTTVTIINIEIRWSTATKKQMKSSRPLHQLVSVSPYRSVNIIIIFTIKVFTIWIWTMYSQSCIYKTNCYSQTHCSFVVYL